ncbi:mitogen-activated protein kinase kinase [Pseudohyphozyma bogoriensis]|nr:mitogen-activated protein kinase kinase [Pseudohyphozyma bogoriensis]
MPSSPQPSPPASPHSSTSSLVSTTDTSTAPSTPGAASVNDDPMATTNAPPAAPSAGTDSPDSLNTITEGKSTADEAPGMKTLVPGMSVLDIQANHPALDPAAPASASAPPTPAPTLAQPTPAPVPPPLFPRPTAPVIAPRRPVGPGGGVKAGVRGLPAQAGGVRVPPSLQAKLAAVRGLSFRPSSATAPARGGGMRNRPRPGLTLSAMAASRAPTIDKDGNGSEDPFARGPAEKGAVSPRSQAASQTAFANFSKVVDPSGRLNFASKAVLHADGVDFSSGASFKIKMDEFDLMEELGKGNYGTVQKVFHKPSKVVMALKEIRLELDESKLKTIVTELDVLHRATSPHIIEFFGAFFIESCVYLCMEFMDGGSLEKVSGVNVSEEVLARTTRGMVEGLKFLKDELKIMHRDVKPTNVLINRKGDIKLCDFGVSGQLDRSLAKTNIGCQSYMAPERIKGESQGTVSSYTASSDVWSLGLSLIEFAVGRYPYPPETYSNVFAQLTAIVHGDPPTLPAPEYSETARDFVYQCLIKAANQRPTYQQLLDHPFLKQDVGREVDMAGWIAGALEYRETNPRVVPVALA